MGTRLVMTKRGTVDPKCHMTGLVNMTAKPYVYNYHDILECINLVNTYMYMYSGESSLGTNVSISIFKSSCPM